MNVDWVKGFRAGAESTQFAALPAPALTEDQQTKLDSLIERFSDLGYTLPPKDGEAVDEQYGAGLTDDEKMFLSKEQLVRFLVADKWILPTAIARTEKCLNWRRSINIYDVDEMAIRVGAEFGETMGQIVYGFSVGGEPCVIMIPSRRQDLPSQLGLIHLFFLLERSADLMPAGVSKVVFAIDMGGKRKHSMPLGLAKEFITVLGTYYPERLGKGMMVNVPTVIRFFLNTIWPFIDPNTKSKVAWPLSITPGGVPGSVSAIIPSSNLQKEFGGDVDLTPSREVQDTYWSALLKVSGERREVYRKKWRELGGKVGESEVACKSGGGAVAEAVTQA